MSDDPISTLLEDDVWQRERTRAWPLAVLAVCLVVAVLGVWWLLGRGGGAETLSADAAEGSTTSSTTMAAVPVDLVPYLTVPQVLNLPTVLPAGWERCGTTVMCDPDDPTRSIRRRDLVTAPANALLSGVSGLVFPDTPAVEIAIVIPSAPGIAFAASGLTRDDLLAVVASVPLATDDTLLVPDEGVLEERPDRDVVASLLGIEPDAVAGQFFFEAADLGISVQFAEAAGELGGIPGARLDMRASALALADPVSVSTERTLIVGSDGGGAFSTWLQRGYRWRVFGSLSADSLTDLVLGMEERIAGLP